MVRAVVNSPPLITGPIVAVTADPDRRRFTLCGRRYGRFPDECKLCGMTFHAAPRGCSAIDRPAQSKRLTRLSPANAASSSVGVIRSRVPVLPFTIERRGQVSGACRARLAERSFNGPALGAGGSHGSGPRAFVCLAVSFWCWPCPARPREGRVFAGPPPFSAPSRVIASRSAFRRQRGKEWRRQKRVSSSSSYPRRSVR